MSERYVFTPDGRQRLEDRVRRVRAEYRAVCDDNPAALESGDSSGWHDNFAFEENMRQMHRLARRVRDLEEMLARSEVVQPLRSTPVRVMLGASVTWRFVDEQHTRTCWIAGYEDGDPVEGRVSYNSPLGRALVGAEEGDEREVSIGGQLRRVEVLELGPSPEAVWNAAS